MGAWISEVYSETSQTSMMEFLANSSILDVWLGPKCASEYIDNYPRAFI